MDAESERRRMVNPRKAYPVDPGLIPVFDRSGDASLEQALETVVRIELERRHMDVGYVRTEDGAEVDFLARSPEGEQALIEVCADLRDLGTHDREVRALLTAAEEHPDASLTLVTLTPEAARGVPDSIKLQDAAVWFLEPWLSDACRPTLKR
jgi:predicted AAA+ superfamily ATPase